MRRDIRNLALSLVLTACALPASAIAGTILDTGTPTNGTKWTLNRLPGDSSGQNLAVRFQLTQATTITEIDGFVGGDGGTFTVAVSSDGGPYPLDDGPLGLIFQQHGLSSVAGDGSWSGTSGINWSLSAGTYWAIFAVLPSAVTNGASNDTLNGWMMGNAPNPTPAEAFFTIPTYQWHRNDALNIGVRIFDNTPTAGGVPEPASWALMITGFGFAGMAMRRRRTAAAYNHG